MESVKKNQRGSGSLQSLSEDKARGSDSSHESSAEPWEESAGAVERCDGFNERSAARQDADDPAPPLAHQRERIQEIPLALARPFIEKWHYSKRVPTGKNVFFGWFIGARLYAVADYGIGVNGLQASYLGRITGKPVTPASLYELKRLCRIEPRDEQFPLSRFLARCHRLLKQKGIRFIVSFSDPEHNRLTRIKDTPYCSGGLYKAANFQYLGKTNPERHLLDNDGAKRHRRYAYRYLERQRRLGNRMSPAEARAILGVTPIRTEPKDRWFLDLGPGVHNRGGK